MVAHHDRTGHKQRHHGSGSHRSRTGHRQPAAPTARSRTQRAAHTQQGCRRAQRGAGIHAQHGGIGQRIAEHGLHQQPAYGQGGTHQGGGEQSGQAQLADNEMRGTIGGQVPTKCLPHLGGRERDTAVPQVDPRQQDEEQQRQQIV